MPGIAPHRVLRRLWVGAVLCALCGCHALHHHHPHVPRELEKVSLPPYVIESPDILLIDAIKLIPKPPHRIQPLDSLAIQVTETLPEQPISGIYPVETDGTVNLGFNYGAAPVS